MTWLACSKRRHGGLSRDPIVAHSAKTQIPFENDRQELWCVSVSVRGRAERATTRDTPPCRFRVEGGAPGVGVTGVGVRGRAGRQLYKNNGARTRVIVARSLMRTWREGPAVSLKGSPTVSPTMAALWASERLPPYWPVSMYFLALSQAPPPLFISMAMRMPAMVPTMSRPATAVAPPRLTGWPLMVGTLDIWPAVRTTELVP